MSCLETSKSILWLVVESQGPSARQDSDTLNISLKPSFFPVLFRFNLDHVEYETEGKVQIAHEDEYLVFVENYVKKGAEGMRM